MGENGRRLVEAKYTWPAIAEQMKAAYEHVLQIFSQPLCNCFVSDRTEQTPDIGWYEPTKGGNCERTVTEVSHVRRKEHGPEGRGGAGRLNLLNTVRR